MSCEPAHAPASSAPIAGPNTTVPLDHTGRVETEVACGDCGYNLRRLHIEDNCPECGTPVAASARGDALAVADPAWLSTLIRGCILYYVSFGAYFLAGLAYGIATAFLGFAAGVSSAVTTVIGLAIMAIPTAIYLTTVYHLTGPDPHGFGNDAQRPNRSTARIAAWVGSGAVLAGVVVASQLNGYALPTSGAPGTARSWLAANQALTLLANLAAWIVTISLLAIGASLATRAPDRRLGVRFRWVRKGAMATLCGLLIAGLVDITVTQVTWSGWPPAGTGPQTATQSGAIQPAGQPSPPQVAVSPAFSRPPLTKPSNPPPVGQPRVSLATEPNGDMIETTITHEADGTVTVREEVTRFTGATGGGSPAASTTTTRTATWSPGGSVTQMTSTTSNSMSGATMFGGNAFGPWQIVAGILNVIAALIALCFGIAALVVLIQLHIRLVRAKRAAVVATATARAG